jgi:adenylate cyclase
MRATSELRSVIDAAQARVEGGFGLSDEAVARLTKVALVVAIVGANAVGACIVFVVAAFVIPSPRLSNTGTVLVVNGVAAGIYLIVAALVGTLWGASKLKDVQAAIREEREPGEHEQRAVLRAPLELFFVQTALWLLAAVLFGVGNAFYNVVLGLNVATAVVLGGVSTASVAYLLAERILRPAAIRLLAAGAPPRLAVPGLAVRSLLAWGLGTAVPVVGLIAVAIGALSDPKTASKLQLSVTMIVLGGIALTVGLLASFIAARAAADPVASVRRALAQVEHGDLDVEVPVYDGTDVGLLQAGFNRMVVGLREREQLQDLFGRQVGEDVARQALERGVELGGEVRDVAVLFVDLVGSTTLAAERPPGEVVELLNRFFDVVIDVIDEHGGFVNKFEGDAALAIFGAPVPLEDHYDRALRAARTLAIRLPERVPEVDAGIGVSGGEAVAGNIGAHRRFEYTVIGDPVNEAARLTEVAKSLPARVAASGAMLERASPAEAGHWSLGETVTLHGRRTPTRIATPRDGP